MSRFAKLMQQAASGNAGGADLDAGYIAVAHRSGGYFSLIDHTSVGSISVADTVSLAGVQGASADFSPDGNYICVGTLNADTLYLLSHNSGTVSISNSVSLSGDPEQLRFSPDGNYVAVVMIAGGVNIYSYSGGSLVYVTNINVYSQAVQWTADSQYLVIGGLRTSDSAGQIHLYENNGDGTFTIRSSVTLSGSASFIQDMDLSADGYLAILNQATPYFYLYRVVSNSLVLQTTYTLSRVARSVVFSKDSQYIIIGVYPDFLILDHTTAGSVSFHATQSDPNVFDWTTDAFSFSAQGNYLAVGTGNNSYRINVFGYNSGSLTYLATTSIAGTAESVAHSQHQL